MQLSCCYHSCDIISSSFSLRCKMLKEIKGYQSVHLGTTSDCECFTWFGANEIHSRWSRDKKLKVPKMRMFLHVVVTVLFFSFLIDFLTWFCATICTCSQSGCTSSHAPPRWNINRSQEPLLCLPAQTCCYTGRVREGQRRISAQQQDQEGMQSSRVAQGINIF